MPLHSAATMENSGGRFIQLPVPVSFFLPVASSQTIPSGLTQFQGIWDTGASNTVISSRVAQQLGLTPTSFTPNPVLTGGGEVAHAPVHLLEVVLYTGLACQMLVNGLFVTELPDLKNADVLIGMDIISLGDFAVTNVGGKGCVSFRMPSLKKIDFVPETNLHNMKMSRGGQSHKNKPKKRKRK